MILAANRAGGTLASEGLGGTNKDAFLLRKREKVWRKITDSLHGHVHQPITALLNGG